MGVLTNETLQDYQNFQTAGAGIKKQVIEDFGGFKPSIKLTFVYEFLLRLTYNSVLIMSIPKLGYKHTNMILILVSVSPEISISENLSDMSKYSSTLSK